MVSGDHSHTVESESMVIPNPIKMPGEKRCGGHYKGSKEPLKLLVPKIGLQNLLNVSYLPLEKDEELNELVMKFRHDSKIQKQYRKYAKSTRSAALESQNKAIADHRVTPKTSLL